MVEIEEESLTPEEREQLGHIQAKIKEAGSDAARAKLEAEGKISRARWKMQIWIKSERSIRKPLSFTLSVWESGKRLHGGGDESAFFCKRKPGAARPKAPFAASSIHQKHFKREPQASGCGGVIPGEAIRVSQALCPHCGLQWDTEQIADAIFYQVPVEKAAEILANWFRELNSDADIYAKYRDDDIRTKMMAQSYGIKKARELKGLTIYPLHRIIKDTAAGATVESRIKAFLLA